MRLQSKIIDSQKTDLLLINQISKPSRIAKLQAPTNIQQLHNLLKYKNVKCRRSKQQVQNAQNWLNKQGIDITPLQEKLKRAKDITIQRQQLKKIEEDCLFYIPDMSAKKIDEYLVKTHEYGALNIIQKNMKNQKISSTIINRVKSKRRQATYNQNKQKIYGVISQINTQTRDDEKRQKYLKCVSRMANKNIQREDFVRQIKRQVDSKMWAIMDRHIKALREAHLLDNKQRLATIYMESLKLVQQSYNSQLPQDIQRLNSYLRDKYLHKLQKKEQRYLRDKEHLAFWGKTFLFYRAGRFNQFYNLLSTRNQTFLMRQFKNAEQSIANFTPKVSDRKFDELQGTDVFKDQLIFALKGESKYSSQAISDPSSLDLIWIILRNLGIFYQKVDTQFQEYKNKILQFYSQQQSSLNSTQIYNYYYLAAYNQIAQRGINCVMDQDDYVHFLICLAQNPKLIGNNKNYEKIQAKLSRQLVLYIQELISLGRKQYVYYTALIPKRYRVQQISTIVSNSNFFSSYDWQYLKKATSSEQFTKIVQKTILKQIALTNDHIEAAQKYVQLLNDKNMAIRCLLQYLIKSFYCENYSIQMIQRAQQACDRYMYKSQELQTSYRDVLAFVIECKKISQFLDKKKDVEIYNLIKNSNYVLLGTVLLQKNQLLFNNLIQLSPIGMETYFKFITFCIKGLQNFLARQRQFQELQKFASLLQENIHFILSHEKYSKYRNKYQTIYLLNLLSEMGSKAMEY